MKRTALYENHVELGGRMVDFAGWALPVQYPTGPVAEHTAVREAAGLFDIDHMGQFELTGPDAIAFLERVQVGAVAGMEVNDARYSLLTYSDGTIVDDVFLYCLPGRWLIVVNAANRAKDYAWLQAHIGNLDVQLVDISNSTYMLALQGPKAEKILQRVTDADLSSLDIRRATTANVSGINALIGRTGYTGEDGFELYFAEDAAVKVWQDLLQVGEDDGLLPCGLAARDSLRFEASMPLYGHEISSHTNPIEARLGWAVDYEHEFVGRNALLKSKLEGVSRKLVGLEMLERAVPRENYLILSDGQTIGHVTTGMRSPTLGKFLAMGYVTSDFSKIGTEIEILVRQKAHKAIVVKRPFYRRPG